MAFDKRETKDRKEINHKNRITARNTDVNLILFCKRGFSVVLRPQLGQDAGQQFLLGGAFGGGGGLFLFGPAQRHQAVHGLDDAEQHERHDDKVEDRRDKRAQAQRVGAVGQRQHHIAEIGAEGDAQQRVEDVVGQRGDDALERRADDDADGQGPSRCP